MTPIGVFVYCLLFHLAKGQLADYDAQQEDDGRIVSGTGASPGMLPYAAQVLGSNGVFCTGSILINTAVTLTAAHCIYTNTSYRVLVGSVFLGQGTRYNVTKIILHPNWNPVTLDNDLALLKTNPMVFNAFVGAVSLPNQPLPLGSPVIPSGYGQTSANSQLSSQLLLTVARTVSPAQCFGTNDPWSICTIAINGGGICFGDSGGSMVQLMNGTYYIYGVNSYIFSSSCATGLPNVAAYVWYYVSWIKATMLAM